MVIFFYYLHIFTRHSVISQWKYGGFAYLKPSAGGWALS